MSSTAVAQKSISWVGMDVSADTFDVCLYPLDCDPKTPSALRRLAVGTFDRTEQGTREFLGGLSTDNPLHLVMESTGRYSSQLATWILELCPDVRVSIINPRRVSDHAKALGMRSRTDPICARIIASYGATFQPKPWNRSAPEYQELQAMTRVRQGLVEQCTAIKNQLGDLARETLPKQRMADLKLGLSSIEQALIEQIQHIEAQIEELLATHIELKADRDLADTIPGVGHVVAGTLMAELGDVRRFGSRKQIEVYAGVNVSRRVSGRTINKTLGLSKEGSSRVRRCLYLAAMGASRGDNALARHYRQMVARGKNKKCALGSVMRKILGIYRRVLISGRDYHDNLVEPRTQGLKK